MGYGNSKRAIKRVESFLKELVSSEGLVVFQHEDASKLAYCLREGIQISKHYALSPEGNPVPPYSEYARLASKYIVRVKGSTVVCEPRDVVPSFRKEMVVTIPEVQDTLGIIGAAIMHNAPVLVFPDANDSTISAERLATWATEKGYDVVVADNHVTLRKHEHGEKGNLLVGGNAEGV